MEFERLPKNRLASWPMVEELEEETLRRVFETNVLAPLMLAKHALPLLRRGSEPVVVNVASVVGRRGIPGRHGVSGTG